MNWRGAFLRQAASDDAVRQLLVREGAPPCQQLHDMQMVTEKLAKGLLQNLGDTEPPVPTHVAFARLLQVIKTSPEYRRFFGYADARRFRAYLNSMPPLAAQIERLAPGVASLRGANAEYPWFDPASGQVIAPVDFTFPYFDPRSPLMVRMDNLVSVLLRVE